VSSYVVALIPPSRFKRVELWVIPSARLAHWWRGWLMEHHEGWRTMVLAEGATLEVPSLWFWPRRVRIHKLTNIGGW
jgi:hypothetical protein